MEKLDIYLYNTLSKEKEVFKPIEEELVKIYSCGPTVYKDATIGNMRTNIFQDLLRRVLKYNGYKLKHAMNITDVGHLVSDGDEGEDKMLKSAKEENKSPMEIAKHYTDLFFKDLKSLNIDTPEIVCKATDHIKEMEEYVKELIENGYAYETSSAIYFDVSKLDKYGILSGINLEDQMAGARVEVDNEKRNHCDFALWIKAPSNHLMKWESEWGLCYPGWHIECSAMGQKYLGEQFDIHTGGIDLVPTHHENEIAQSKGKCGKIPANYWMHGEYLLINGGKMSKSLNNAYLIKDIIEKGFDPLAYKLFTYSCNYKNKLNFTWEAMEASNKALVRLKTGYINHNNSQNENNIDSNIIEEFKTKFIKCINDDLNITVAMSIVWEVVKQGIKSKDFAKLLLDFDKVLGLDIDKKEDNIINNNLDDINKVTNNIPNEVIELIEKRKEARQNKDFNASDRLRDEILNFGYIVKDTKDGIEIIKK